MWNNIHQGFLVISAARRKSSDENKQSSFLLYQMKFYQNSGELLSAQRWYIVLWYRLNTRKNFFKIYKFPYKT